MTVNGRVPITNPATEAELVRLYGNRLVEGFPNQFREWTDTVGLDEIGALIARGSAVADFDNDGDLDIVINSIGGEAVLLQNQVPDGNWLMIDLGAVIPGTFAEILLPDGNILIREVYTGSSYLASEDPRLHFGLGEQEIIDQLTLIYPDGTRQIYQAIAANQIWRP